MLASNKDSGAKITDKCEDLARIATESGESLDLRTGSGQHGRWVLITGGKGKPRALLENDPQVIDRWLELHPADRARVQHLFNFFTDLNNTALDKLKK